MNQTLIPAGRNLETEKETLGNIRMASSRFCNPKQAADCEPPLHPTCFRDHLHELLISPACPPAPIHFCSGPSSHDAFIAGNEFPPTFRFTARHKRKGSHRVNKYEPINFGEQSLNMLCITLAPRLLCPPHPSNQVKWVRSGKRDTERA